MTFRALRYAALLVLHGEASVAASHYRAALTAQQRYGRALRRRNEAQAATVTVDELTGEVGHVPGRHPARARVAREARSALEAGLAYQRAIAAAQEAESTYLTTLGDIGWMASATTPDGIDW
jgi:hypothetical protein